MAIRIGDHILPPAELDRRLRTTHPCERCGSRRYFSDRLVDDGLCSPCRRHEQTPVAGLDPHQ